MNRAKKWLNNGIRMAVLLVCVSAVGVGISRGQFKPPNGGVPPMPPQPPPFQPPKMPQPPFGPNGPGMQPPKMPGPPVLSWSCSKCRAVLGTGNFPPNLQTCPNCGVRLINGGIGAPPNNPPVMNPPINNPPVIQPPNFNPPPVINPPGPPNVNPPPATDPPAIEEAFDGPPVANLPPPPELAPRATARSSLGLWIGLFVGAFIFIAIIVAGVVIAVVVMSSKGQDGKKRVKNKRRD